MAPPPALILTTDAHHCQLQHTHPSANVVVCVIVIIVVLVVVAIVHHVIQMVAR